MQDDTDTSPDGANNHGASIRDDIQRFGILIDAGQEGFESLCDLPTDALVFVYFVRKLDFL